ncbi:MAG: hypothetical protein AAF266_12030 [Planctomycetota bacterium]
MRSPYKIAAIALLAVPSGLAGLAGCNFQEHYGHCPTDARAITLSCAGQEAVRKCPCGPDAAYYGHRPTTWTSWPTGWEQYECEQCVVTTESVSKSVSIVNEPTPAIAEIAPPAKSPMSDESVVGKANDDEAVPIEPVESVAPAEPSGDAQEVLPIAPPQRYEPAPEAVRTPTAAPKLPELPSVPAIPVKSRYETSTAPTNEAGLLDLPDPPNPSASEALRWEGGQALEAAPAETASEKKRLPTYADLFQP